MGILSRFKDIMASNINAVFSNKEDKHPEKAIEKYLTGLRADLGQVKSETAAMETDVRRAESAYFEKKAEADKFERYAAKARENGSLSDVSIYENKSSAAMQEAIKLEEKYNQKKADYDNLAAMNDKLTSDITTLEGKLSEIKSKIAQAEAQDKLNKIAAKSGSDNSGEMFDKMTEKADRMLDKANAMAELEHSQPVTDYDDLEALASKYNSDNDGPINIE